MDIKLCFILCTLLTYGYCQEACDTNWILNADRCYQFVYTDQKIHAEAKTQCEEIGATLVSVSDNTERNFLKGRLELYSIESTWIGLTNPGQNCTAGDYECLRTGWTWDDGTQYTYVAYSFEWRYGEPNVNDKYTVIYRTERGFTIYDGWAGIPEREANTPHPYICEKSLFKTTTTTPTPSTPVTTTTMTTSTDAETHDPFTDPVTSAPATFSATTVILTPDEHPCKKCCPAGSFGEDCMESCHCAEDAPCDAVSGKCPGQCADGWTGQACAQAVKGSSTSVLVGVIVGEALGAIVVIGVTVAVILIVIKRKRKNKSRNEADHTYYNESNIATGGNSNAGEDNEAKYDEVKPPEGIYSEIENISDLPTSSKVDESQGTPTFSIKDHESSDAPQTDPKKAYPGIKRIPKSVANSNSAAGAIPKRSAGMQDVLDTAEYEEVEMSELAPSAYMDMQSRTKLKDHVKTADLNMEFENVTTDQQHPLTVLAQDGNGGQGIQTYDCSSVSMEGMNDEAKAEYVKSTYIPEVYVPVYTTLK